MRTEFPSALSASPCGRPKTTTRCRRAPSAFEDASPTARPCQAPSTGFLSKIAPPSTSPSARPPARPLGPLRPDAASAGLVPPSRSLSASTAFATSSLQACCSLLPILGFTGFPRHDTSWPARASALSHRCTRPPEPSPPPAAAHVSPRALAPSSFTAHARLDLEALLRRGVRCVRVTLPTLDRPMLSWASVSWSAASAAPAPTPRRGPTRTPRASLERPLPREEDEPSRRPAHHDRPEGRSAARTSRLVQPTPTVPPLPRKRTSVRIPG